MKKLTRYYPIMLDQSEEGRAFRSFEQSLTDKVGNAGSVFDLLLIEDIVNAGLVGSQMATGRMIDVHSPEEALNALINDTAMLQTWHMYRWHACRSIVYDLDASLVESFLETDIRVPGSAIKMPTDSIYISVPPEMGMKIFNGVTGAHLLDGFLVTAGETYFDVDAKFITKQIALNGKLHDVKLRVGDPMKRFIRVCAIGLPLAGAAVSDNALVTFPILLNTDVIEEEIDNRVATSPYKMMDNNAELIKPWTRIILNALLYLTAEPEDVESDRLGPSDEVKRKAKTGGKAERKLLQGQTVPVSYFKVGKRHGIGRREQVKAVDKALTDNRSLMKSLVRGHWRNQACGEGWKDHKLIWVRPFWRAGTMNEVLARIVKVRSES